MRLQSVKGRVKYNPRLINGVVDEIKSIGSLDVSITDIDGVDYYLLQNTGNTGRTSSKVANSIEFKENTQYTFVINNIYELDDSYNCRLRINYTDGTDDSVFIPTETPTNKTFTSDANKTIEVLTWDASLIGGNTYFEKDSFACYECNSIPDPLPSGWEVGNSFVLDEAYDLAVKADTTDTLFDDTDPSNVIPKVVAIADLPNVINDQMFFEKDESGKLITMGIYKEPLTGECLAKAQNFFNISDFLLDGADFHLLDGDGDSLKVPTS